MFAEVLIEYTNKAVDKTFTYIIPDNLLDKIKVGMKVKVPFNNRIINGFVVNILNSYFGEYELKYINSIEDEYLVLNEELMKLGDFLQQSTLCSKIVAYQTMLPSSLKVKNQTRRYDKYVSYIVLDKDEDEINKYIDEHKRSSKQIEILKDLLINKKILKNKYSLSSVNILISNHIIKEVKEQVYRINIEDSLCNIPKLSEDQQNAINKINLDKFDTYLIHGVTGSGKTEIYMRLIKQVIDNGKTAIMLVPEISLTTQMIKRFYERFGSLVAIFHSALSVGEKYDEYLKIYRGETKIVVGTRSAVFAPITNLGLIVLDEEHSQTFKQDTNPCYNAIDMAKFRAEYNNCPVILGSATPTLESMARAKKGVYKLITLDKRIGNAKLPSIEIVDMVKQIKNGNIIISSILKKKIEDRLNKKEQVILLLNRRGFSTIITCKSCGYTYKCPYCDIALTYHKTSNNLRCHYCGYTVLKDNLCPSCHEDSLNYLGLGTEKLETTIKDMFKSARVIRMDVDTTTNKGSHEKIINAFKNEEYDILLGTQMISKGLDFPKVSLVGVINADTTLNIPDFRSGQRTFELLSQVSGRAGRSDINGEVIIQTFDPSNVYLNFVKDNDYNKYFIYEMNFRKKLKYPPYYYLVNIMIISKEYDKASKNATKVYNYLKSNIDSTSYIFGPTTASIFKINNYYRFQIMIKYRFDSVLMTTLKYLDELYAVKKDVNLQIDINPNKM